MIDRTALDHELGEAEHWLGEVKKSLQPLIKPDYSNLTIRAVPMSKAGKYRTLEIYIAGSDGPYVEVIFHDDPTIHVYEHAFDALAANELQLALELAVELCRRGYGWRPDKE